MRADTFDKQIRLLAYLLPHKVNIHIKKKKKKEKPPQGFKDLDFGWMDVLLTLGRFHSTNPGGGFLKYSDELVAGNSGSSNSLLALMQSFFSS